MVRNNKSKIDLKKIITVKDGCIYKLKSCYDATNLYLKLQEKYGELIDDKTVNKSLIDYENNLKRQLIELNKSELHAEAYNIFLRDIALVNDSSTIPMYSGIRNVDKNFFNSKYWVFTHDFPEFKFGIKGRYKSNFILSMNECHSTYSNYIGTLDNFIKTFNELPNECIFIANNMTSEQQSLLGDILSRGIAAYDGQGCSYIIGKYYWNVIYI